MTTEEMIETVIEEGVKAYRRNYRNCPEGIRLTMKQPVVRYGITFNCWREYAVYKMGQYLKEICPTVDIEITLDGNNSTITCSMTDEEQLEVTKVLYNFIKKVQLCK